MPQRAGRADERQACLLVAREDVHVDAGGVADRRDQLVAVGRQADRRRRHRTQLQGSQLFGEPHLCGDDPRHLGDLLLVDAVVALAALADAGEGALLEELSQLPVGGLGDEQARRVRADVDAGVGHPKRRPGLGRGD